MPKVGDTDLTDLLSFPRAAWECNAGRAASPIRKTSVVTCGAARLDGIPTQRVGTRKNFTTKKRRARSFIFFFFVSFVSSWWI